MKKSILLITFILFGLTTVAAFAEEADMDVLIRQEKDSYYWEHFMETTEILYEKNESEIRYFTKLMEWNGEQAVKNGLDTEFVFHFGAGHGTEVHGYFYSMQDYMNAIGEFKKRIIAEKKFQVSGLARIYHVKDEYTTNSVKILTDWEWNPNLILHNNFQLLVYNSGVTGKRFENGITYHLNPKHSLRARFKTFFVDSPQESQIDFRMAYRMKINDQTTYILYGYLDKTNTHLENVVEFLPVPSLKLTVNTVLNTGKEEINWIQVKVEKMFGEKYRILTDYKKEAVEEGYSYLRMGISFSL